MTTRRRFLKSSALAATGMFLTPDGIFARPNARTRFHADKVKIAYIGIGVFALIALGLIATLFMRKRRKKQ